MTSFRRVRPIAADLGRGDATHDRRRPSRRNLAVRMITDGVVRRLPCWWWRRVATIPVVDAPSVGPPWSRASSWRGLCLRGDGTTDLLLVVPISLPGSGPNAWTGDRHPRDGSSTCTCDRTKATISFSPAAVHTVHTPPVVKTPVLGVNTVASAPMPPRSLCRLATDRGGSPRFHIVDGTTRVVSKGRSTGFWPAPSPPAFRRGRGSGNKPNNQ